MPDRENPYRSPESDVGEHREKCKSLFRTTQADEGPDGDLFHYRILNFSYLRLVGPLVLLYCALAIEYPLVWAYGSAALLILGFGFLTSKFIFKIQRPLLVWSLTPLLGSIWLLFFWIIFRFLA